MKKELFAFILLAFAGLLPIMIMASCSKDDIEEVKILDNENGKTSEQPQNADNYYVKYEVQSGSQILYAAYTERTITYKDVDKEKSITTRQGWDGTYGPFKKGDKIYLRVISNMARNNTDARISVSKNKEAFAIKAEERESSTINLEYTINY